MNRQAWLREEIAAWRRDELISAAQADTLLARYPSLGGQWGRLIFVALGAVIFGLGVILAFAYNWEAMHRAFKLALIAAALLASHLTALWLWQRGRRRPAEGWHLLGSMLFGAGIWLVAQIYHIDEHYPNAFLVWSLGALALAWALPSILQGMLAAGLLLLWAWFEVFDFHRSLPAAPWLVAVALLPLAWWQRSSALLGLGSLAFVLLYAFNLLRIDDDLTVPVVWIFSGALMGGAFAVRGSVFPAAAAVLRRLGGLGVLSLLLAGSFSEVSGGLHRLAPDSAQEWGYFGLPVACLIGVWIAAIRDWPRAPPRDADEWGEVGIILLSQTLLIGLCLGLNWSGIAWVIFNLLVIGYGALIIRRGSREQASGQVALGCLLISALVFARFVDLFDSLLWRAGMFLLLGTSLFAVGQFYSRQGKGTARDA